uniref:tyrosine-type recombinase/integrase n=1 Tax=Aliarcobacter sp. TaxID=2321116 RepID=UPI004047BCA9
MSGTVSIYKHPKSNKIYLDINFNGKRKRPSTGLEKTNANLKLVEKEIIPKIQVALANGTFSFEDEAKISSNIFGKFAKSYFELLKENIRESTYKGNLVHYNNQIKPYFENKLISNIKPMDIEKWQNELIKKGYSQNTLLRYKSIFFSIMEKAYKNDVIENNPFKKTNQPKQKKLIIENILEDDKKILPFTEDELQIMFKFEGYIGYYIYLAVYTGMRPSEILALDWKDIDYEQKRIAVYKSILDGEMNKTKTLSSTRYVDMLPNLEIKLKEWQKICSSKLIVFPNRFGKRFYSHAGPSKVFKSRLKQHNIKYRYLYQLRHTFASRYISRLSDGVNILWVSKMLGHKDVSITLNTYTKFIVEDPLKRLDNLEKMAQIWHT